MPKKTARRIIDTRRSEGATILTGVTVSGSPGSGASAAMAGDGLTYSGGVLNVGAGTGITVAADSVSLASTAAGAGLTHPLAYWRSALATASRSTPTTWRWRLLWRATG